MSGPLLGATPRGWPPPVMAAGIGEALTGNVLALSILFIFAAALVTAFLRSRAKDRCLKDFHGFHVTMERMDGKVIWGTFHVYSSGFELLYRKERRDAAGHVEGSYIVYGTQYGDVRALYRFHDELTARDRRRRRRSARRTYRRDPLRWVVRKMRNVLNTFRDAVVQSLGVVVGQMRKASPGSALLAGQDQRIVGLGSEMVGAAGNAYDPILERYVGRRVVLQLQTEKGITEYPGILKEYTANFLEVLNVPLRWPAAAAGEGSGPGTAAQASLVHSADVVVPRTVAVIRHAGPREPVRWQALLAEERREER